MTYASLRNDGQLQRTFLPFAHRWQRRGHEGDGARYKPLGMRCKMMDARRLIQVFQPKFTTITLTTSTTPPIVLWKSLLVAGYSTYVTLDSACIPLRCTRHNLLLARRPAMASSTGEIGSTVAIVFLRCCRLRALASSMPPSPTLAARAGRLRNQIISRLIDSPIQEAICT
jgi:hypothetical protein